MVQLTVSPFSAPSCRTGASWEGHLDLHVDARDRQLVRSTEPSRVTRLPEPLERDLVGAALVADRGGQRRHPAKVRLVKVSSLPT